jgi:hypothetical protein
MPALPNQRGGPSTLPMPKYPPAPSMKGVGKSFDNRDTSLGKGARERLRENKHTVESARAPADGDVIRNQTTGLLSALSALPLCLLGRRGRRRHQQAAAAAGLPLIDFRGSRCSRTEIYFVSSSLLPSRGERQCAS